MPRVPRRKRLTRRAGWWKGSSKSSRAQNPATDQDPAVVNPINELPINNPTMNPYPMVHGQVDHETDNPANHEYLQNAEEYMQHYKKHTSNHVIRPCENHLHCPIGEH